jgi:AcrR family transcriptional regulator
MAATINRDNKLQVPRKRIRRSPEEARWALLDAAQAILVDQGPAAVTLKAVSHRLGMTHGNVTHHFGTRSALHSELVARLAEQLTERAGAAVVRLRKGEVSAEQIVDMFFETFEASGLGKLFGFIAANGATQELTPIMDVIRNNVRTLRAGEPANTDRNAYGAGPILLSLISYALTSALIGVPLERAADMPGSSLKRLAADELRRLRALPDPR